MAKTQTTLTTYSAKSMTAFARIQENTSFGRFSWEIRSVNQRYLEINPRLPDAFRYLEPALREQVKKHIARGKLDISLSFEATTTSQAMHVNMDVLTPLTQAINQVQQSMIEATQVNPLEVLQWPGVLQETTEQDIEDKVEEILLSSLEQAITLLTEHRLREGQALAQLIAERCDNIQQLIDRLEPLLPKMLDNHAMKLKQRIQALTEQMDENRYHQEVAVLAQKMDVTEELDRLKTHLQEVELILKNNSQSTQKLNPVGRKLDFIMQELNREANTLGSKAMDSHISQTSVELKVLIEQMREQVQNIE